MPRNDLKAYTSLIARIPQDLADQVKRYAREHRCSVSELIRDGLEMRLDTDLPWHAPGDSHGAESEVLPEVIHGLDALTPILHALVRETVRATMSEVLHEVLHGETSRRAVMPEVLHEVLPDSVEVIPEVLPYGDHVIPGHTSPLQAPSEAPNGGMPGVIPHEVLHGHTSADRESEQEGGGMTEVLLSSAPKHRGRKPVLRPGILALLDEHPDGLTAAELKVYLGTAKPIGDTLAGMVKAALLVKTGSGHAIRYQLAEATPL